MVNGKLVETQTSDVTGLMIIPVTVGENDVRIAFVRTPDRTLGSALSLLTVIVLVVLWIKTAPQVRARFVGANLGTSPATRKDL